MVETNDNNDNESSSNGKSEARPGRPDTRTRDEAAPQNSPDLPPATSPDTPDNG